MKIRAHLPNISLCLVTLLSLPATAEEESPDDRASTPVRSGTTKAVGSGHSRRAPGSAGTARAAAPTTCSASGMHSRRSASWTSAPPLCARR